MYQPPHHREDRLEVQHALIRAHPLGTLVTLGSGGLVANPLPFVLDAAAGPLGTLKAHLARANPQWRDFDPAVEALVVFQGVEGYITPSWYPTKRETGKVVPTWNYAIVQARGPTRIVEDRAWLAEQIAALTAAHEAGRAAPWSVDDAPPPFVEAQLKGIVGIEIPITRIEGKWKMSQNRPEPDRAGVVEGLRAAGDATSLAMADLVEAHRAVRTSRS
jgi:transcriptional regulator